jgi:hypothetical protein
VQETVDATLNRVISSGIRWGASLALWPPRPVRVKGLSRAVHVYVSSGSPRCSIAVKAQCVLHPDVRVSLRPRSNPLTPCSGASYYEGSFSNISRNADGDYVAVSSRGNFFMTWSPGELK